MEQKTRKSGKRTTPEMSADYRLKIWMSGKCPYCGGSITSRIDANRKAGKPAPGFHFKCLNDECKAENAFSNKRMVKQVGEEWRSKV